MDTVSGLTIIFNYRKHNAYALNVILGALETMLPTLPMEVRLVNSLSELVSATEEALQRQHAVVVGWSFYSPGFRECVAELNKVREVVDNERVIHLAGGVHATAEPEQTLRAGFDLVAIGEGEKTIIELLTKMLGGEDYHQVKGIAYIDENGSYISNGSGERVDLNDYHPFAPGHKKFNPIEITRGCIYACKFCQTPFMFKAKFRHRSVENVCRYVRFMKDHRLKDIRFITPTSLSYGSPDDSVHLDQIEELLASVRAVLGNDGRIFFGTFPSEVRPEHVTPEALMILKKYVANNNLIIGGQSGSNRILSNSGRGHSVEDIIKAVRFSLEFGFIPKVDFIFGMPGEEAADVQASLELAEQLTEMGAMIHGHTFMPLPGTPYKNAPPGKIGREAMRQLQDLVRRGKLYGQWTQQIGIARELAKGRRPPKNRRINWR